MTPTKTKSAGNLPTSLSSFIGRIREISEVTKLISANRLVTLTGAGGSGKTRLALKVGEELLTEFQDGVWFVEFASIADPAFVPQAVAAVLNIREQAGQTLMNVLIDDLSKRQVLLVLDNCEHLISACATFTETLLHKCPDLKILVTSREAMGILGEMVWTVPLLSLPGQQPWTNPRSAHDAITSYEKSEAVQLFVARAKAISSDFQLTAENGAWVAEICRHLDGMPLAIELAAARVRSLSVQQITQRLDDRFHLLTGGNRTAPPRQQTLAATLDWSYTLLSDEEQKVLQRLSVFIGGATIEAAEAVCSDENESNRSDAVHPSKILDVLSHLVDKSLVLADKPERGETRYHLLETIREYASRKLEEAGVYPQAKDRYLNFFMQWAEKADSNLKGADQLLWLERYNAEHDNLRGALEWSLTSEGKVDLGLRMATCLAGLWHGHGYYSEGRAQLAAFLEKTNTYERSELRAKAVTLAGELAFNQTDYPASRVLFEESLSIYRELGAAGQLGLARALVRLGDMWRQLGNYETALPLLQEGLRIIRELNELHGLAEALWELGYYYISTGDYRRADQFFTEALPLSRQESTEYNYNTAVTLSGLAECAVRQGDFKRAAAFEEESLVLRREFGDKWGLAVSLGNFAWIALHQDELEKAETLLLESLVIRHEIEDRGGMAWCLEKLAKVNMLYGQKKSRNQSSENFRRAVQLFGFASALRAPVGSVIDQADQPEYERDLETLRTALGNEVFKKHWNEGESKSVEEIIDNVLAGSIGASAHGEKEKFGGLSAREREVAALIAQGKSNREMADAMTVSVRTIETYVTRILSKLGFDSRVQIATWSIEKDLDGKESK